MSTLSELAEKFESLLERLPSAIRGPVQREWQPLSELFIKRRAPRLLIVGRKGDLFLRTTLLPASPFAGTPPTELFQPWQSVRHLGRLEYALALDHPHAAKQAIETAPPDCFLLLFTGNSPEDERSLQLLDELYHSDSVLYQEAAPVIAVTESSEITRETVLQALSPGLRKALAAVVPAGARGTLLATIARQLPQSARLEFARFAGETTVQKEIAQTLVSSTTAVCAAIGTQPIPLADFPILSSLQILMIAGIIQISGRQWRMHTIARFLGALGLNLGAGLLLREGARAAIKIFPGFGNAISGAMAGTGTYAIGLAATAYFIDHLTIAEARKQLHFRFGKKKKALPPA